MSIYEHLYVDVESVIADINSFEDEISKFLEFEQLGEILDYYSETQPIFKEINALQERIKLLINRLFGILNSIEEPSDNSFDAGDAIKLSSLANEMQSQLDWLNSLLVRIIEICDREGASSQFSLNCVAPTKGAIEKIKNVLAPLLKKVLSQLWNIISNMLTPKEWKLHGKVGTGLLGLADVGIEITFGK